MYIINYERFLFDSFEDEGWAQDNSCLALSLWTHLKASFKSFNRGTYGTQSRYILLIELF